MANNISLASYTAASLKTLFSKINHIYYYAGEINQTTIAASAGIVVDYEFPVLEDSVNFDTGSVDKTEVKILDGTIWTSRSSKGDSDISFQIASVNMLVNQLFLTYQHGDGTTHSYDNITVFGTSGFGGKGFALDVKKCTGALVMTDDTGDSVIVLPAVEMYGSLVAGDGENPAYFNVTVTPSVNADGDSLIILNK